MTGWVMVVGTMIFDDEMNTMSNEKYPESELTGNIIGCCMEVHRILGNGFRDTSLKCNYATFLSGEVATK